MLPVVTMALHISYQPMGYIYNNGKWTPSLLSISEEVLLQRDGKRPKRPPIRGYIYLSLVNETYIPAILNPRIVSFKVTETVSQERGIIDTQKVSIQTLARILCM